jgi:hypothetical protein
MRVSWESTGESTEVGRLRRLRNLRKTHSDDHTARSITIGDVTVAITDTPSPECVPEYLDPLYEDSQEVLRHLRWIMQKDRLGQDVFLLGPPGPTRRALGRTCWTWGHDVCLTRCRPSKP